MKSILQNRKFLYIIFSFIIHFSFAQSTGIVRGKIIDKLTKEPIIGALIQLDSAKLVSQTDENGDFKIEKIPVGSYNIKISYIGYLSQTKFNINITSGNAQILGFELVEDSKQLEEVEVTINRNRLASMADIITPLSTQSLTTEEIKANPGGNFDISRVVQALPGVAGSPTGFRNDIIIRGGAPNENVFYLDGVEIPVINHFQTQGSSGGPQGLLNVSFIEDVKLSSSAFNAKYDNALASTFEFKQREGNPERLSGNLRLSATELAATFEGPLSKKTNFIVSARRSYLQLLFEAIDLPIRPNYWDFQYKVSHRFDNKTTLKFIGVGAIDEFAFGKTRKSSPENEYILRSNPFINQWNYTVGAVLTRSLNNGNLNVALSRNMFNNDLDQFEDRQTGDESKRTLKLRSQEIENKLRIDVTKLKNGWKYSYGIVAQYVKFNNNISNKLRKEIKDSNGNIIQPELTINSNTTIDFVKYGAFGQLSKGFFANRLTASLGIRTDMNTFTTEGNNPLNNLSPRLSMAYSVSDKWKISGSVGSYSKIPIYTLLGYKAANGEFVNKNMKYIQSIHYVAGVEFLPKEDLRFTLESFYKDYSNYPISKRTGISLANQGTEFGAIGNEEVTSNGKGQAYGFEFYIQKKLTKNIFAIFSYTFVRSLFSGSNGVLIASSWDNRHLISGIIGRKFKKGWEIGLKYRFAAGAPYTPFDDVTSQRNYQTIGVGTLDVSQLNSLRLANFNQFDFRGSKTWNFNKWSFQLYMDIQNAFRFNTPSFPQYTFKRTEDNSAFATSDGNVIAQDGSNAIPVILQNNDPVFLPSFGFIAEF
ncbi:MAG: TonB-dependent receptor [Bacteroidetes bacterium]|nr:MAG: TonB-dependent receptor [Bacteroidota bacterium]